MKVENALKYLLLRYFSLFKREVSKNIYKEVTTSLKVLPVENAFQITWFRHGKELKQILQAEDFVLYERGDLLNSQGSSETSEIKNRESSLKFCKIALGLPSDIQIKQATYQEQHLIYEAIFFTSFALCTYLIFNNFFLVFSIIGLSLSILFFLKSKITYIRFIIETISIVLLLKFNFITCFLISLSWGIFLFLNPSKKIRQYSLPWFIVLQIIILTYFFLNKPIIISEVSFSISFLITTLLSIFTFLLRFTRFSFATPISLMFYVLTPLLSLFSNSFLIPLFIFIYIIFTLLIPKIAKYQLESELTANG